MQVDNEHFEVTEAWVNILSHINHLPSKIHKPYDLLLYSNQDVEIKCQHIETKSKSIKPLCYKQITIYWNKHAYQFKWNFQEFVIESHNILRLGFMQVRQTSKMQR
jgi:hypothetical protein